VFTCDAVPEPDGSVKIYWGRADTVMCVGESLVSDLVHHLTLYGASVVDSPPIPAIQLAFAALQIPERSIGEQYFWEEISVLTQPKAPFATCFEEFGTVDRKPHFRPESY